MPRVDQGSGAPSGAAPPRFLLDAMLGRLAVWLRLLGYDAVYAREEDPLLIARCRREGRILLTRDTGLLARQSLPPHLGIGDDRVQEQLRQVVRAFGLTLRPIAERRCSRCNVLLQPRSRAEVASLVPEHVWSHQVAFWGCPDCRRIYWAGSQARHVDETLRALFPR